MTTYVLPVVLGVALLSSGCTSGFAQLINECAVTAPRNATLAVDGATQLRVMARAGSLDIVGQPGLAEVRVQGTACARSQEALEQVQLVTDRSGDALVIETRIDTSNGQLDLVVEVPESLAVTVDDTSGSVEVDGVAALTIDDGSGSIRVANVAGDVRVADGSGSIDIRGVGGSVFAEDGSGSIDIRDVRADVEIADDGSGSIDVADVGGDFTVRDDGTGGIRYDRVGGRVSVPAY